MRSHLLVKWQPSGCPPLKRAVFQRFYCYRFFTLTSNPPKVRISPFFIQNQQWSLRSFSICRHCKAEADAQCASLHLKTLACRYTLDVTNHWLIRSFSGQDYRIIGHFYWIFKVRGTFFMCKVFVIYYTLQYKSDKLFQCGAYFCTMLFYHCFRLFLYFPFFFNNLHYAFVKSHDIRTVPMSA